jgi:methanogenic corrinoid protein MtbC1
MAESGRLSSVDDTPVYTIKTVVQQTGITPATLRAWERRYGALSPGRSDGGYRLYSERDIARLRWLKNQVDTGVSISSAVALLELQHKTGQQPEREPLTAVARTPVRGARNADTVTQGLLAALLAFREMEAETILAEAFALYAIEDVAEEIIVPVLVEIGELWHRGEASIIQEHFATAFLRRRLSALFHAYDQPASGPLAIAGSAPGEWHDVGILLVSLVLRRHGWRVIYLGQNVPAANLVEEIRHLRPSLVCLSATTTESLPGLTEIAVAIAELPNPRPRLALGGRIFHLQAELKARFPETILVGSARELVTALARP